MITWRAMAASAMFYQDFTLDHSNVTRDSVLDIISTLSTQATSTIIFQYFYNILLHIEVSFYFHVLLSISLTKYQCNYLLMLLNH